MPVDQHHRRVGQGAEVRRRRVGGTTIGGDDPARAGVLVHQDRRERQHVLGGHIHQLHPGCLEVRPGGGGHRGATECTDQSGADAERASHHGGVGGRTPCGDVLPGGGDLLVHRRRRRRPVDHVQGGQPDEPGIDRGPHSCGVTT